MVREPVVNAPILTNTGGTVIGACGVVFYGDA